MPSIEYSFKFKSITGISYNNTYLFKYKSLTNFPFDKKYNLKYYMPIIIKKNELINFISLEKDYNILTFIYNFGLKNKKIYTYMIGEIQNSLKYVSGVKGKINFTKHFEIELYTIPLIIELFDINLIVNPPEFHQYDILLGGYLYMEDSFDDNTVRAGISGNDGFVISQSSPEMKYSIASYNFKSAKKSPLPLTWAEEVKPLYSPPTKNRLVSNKYVLFINNDDTKLFYGKTKVKRIYVKVADFKKFINKNDVSTLKIKLRNGSIISSFNENTIDSIDNFYLFSHIDILQNDIIKTRFDIEQSKYIVIYYSDTDNKEFYECII